MSIPIVPAVVIGGVVYVAATHAGQTPLPAPPPTPPPGLTVRQAAAFQVAPRPPPRIMQPLRGPITVDPNLKASSWDSVGNVDPKLQAALDAGYAAAKAKFDTLDDDAKVAAAAAINKQFDLTPDSIPPALSAKDAADWKTVAQIAEAAAGAAIGASIGGPFGAKVGALLGAYLGVKLNDWLAGLDVSGWFQSGNLSPDQAWAIIHGKDASSPEAAAAARAAFDAMDAQDQVNSLISAAGVTHF